MKKLILLTVILSVICAAALAQRTTTQSNQNKFYLTVNSSIDQAKVFIDNKFVGKTGKAFVVVRGWHKIEVKAEGYSEYKTTMNVKKDSKIFALLKELTHKLKLTSNAGSARIWINSVDYGQRNLNAPFRIELFAGQIKIKVFSEGYFMFEKVLNLRKDTDLYAELIPRTATIKLKVPQYYLAAYRNALKFVILSVDGKVYRGHELELSAGKHDVTITTGGISFTQTMYLKPGGIYEISPNFSFSVNQTIQGFSMR